LTSVTVLTGLADDQVITRTTLPVFVLTGAGNDIVVDNYSSDALFLLGAGDDQARPSPGPNNVFGEAGVDSVWYRDDTVPLEVSLDDVANDGRVPRNDNIHSDIENILGGRGDDVLIGSDAANLIDGRQGSDTILGRGGDDRFAALGNGQGFPNGADSIFGGAGNDTVSYEDRTSGVVVRLDDLAFDGEPGENDNVHSDVETITGSSVADVLTGSPSSNHLFGLTGNDRLDGGLGTDVLDGGPGTDTASYADRTRGVVVRLNALADDGQAGEGDNVLQIENLTGGAGSDTLVGDKFRNALSGGAGNDTIRGLDQDDQLAGGSGRDVLDAGSGSDTVSYADHVAAVTASLDGVANDGQSGELDNVLNAENLIGGSGPDRLTGNAARNVLRGLLGNDRLRGSDNNDTLIGSEGIDFADGGRGVDVCQVESSTGCP
jgi:Ca2+-binding RTX toxin-like protein